MTAAPQVTQLDRLPVETVPIASLRTDGSPRAQRENAEHAGMLAALAAPLPPILVHRRTMRVIDGAHRVRAAAIRGHDTIAARFFNGSQSAAFVLSVQANIAHGLPLSRAEREAAAARIVADFPAWSDRAIAAFTTTPRSGSPTPAGRSSVGCPRRRSARRSGNS